MWNQIPWTELQASLKGNNKCTALDANKQNRNHHCTIKMVTISTIPPASEPPQGGNKIEIRKSFVALFSMLQGSWVWHFALTVCSTFLKLRKLFSSI
ncbi:hypothetical protein O6P43_012357 [Quillaja saponaria]|uniref:Uncharacterized protein n=1 Tax=Quillaja saponaria TaxID=32244 RepID=A0AAD7M1Z8_QUISA|nr:hypothetical protein O6P43_012357 [Quillaja saponaria]